MRQGTEQVGMSAERLARIDPPMQALVDRGVYAGVSTIVARRGEIVHQRRYGLRDKEAALPMTEDTIFRLYSMTKPIICTALMTLFEEGKFHLIDPIAKYPPAFGRVKVREADGSPSAPRRPICPNSNSARWRIRRSSTSAFRAVDQKFLRSRSFSEIAPAKEKHPVIVRDGRQRQ